KPLTQPALLVQVLLLAAASWLCSLLSGYVLMIAFFGHGDWAATLLFSAAASLAVAVPAVPGNLGTYELSILLALRAAGYGEPVATATAFAVAVHAVNLLVNSALGVVGFIREGVSLDQLSQGVREMKQPLN
ncbi:MAG: lysylphosphatidylglycerol synthase domain-containing protein, partial [Chloroflexota bacterium]